MVSFKDIFCRKGIRHGNKIIFTYKSLTSLTNILFVEFSPFSKLKVNLYRQYHMLNVTVLKYFISEAMFCNSYTRVSNPYPITVSLFYNSHKQNS